VLSSLPAQSGTGAGSTTCNVEKAAGLVTSTSTVTASATAKRVRFTAPSNVVRMQLQVISETHPKRGENVALRINH
jgi:hypothetical protein